MRHEVRRESLDMTFSESETTFDYKLFCLVVNAVLWTQILLSLAIGWMTFSDLLAWLVGF